jgi:putative oxygen-independent coproporphyrinogen III oxidase
LADDWQAGGFGLYLHWPFCAAKCPYCDFNSHVTKTVDHDAWRAAFVSEIERAGKRTEGRVLNSVFFGGGTPSLMEPATVDAIMNAIQRTWPTANDLEVTLEANPTSVEAGKFADFRNAGINRVSMGIQALNDTDLRLLGRMHTAAEGLAAFDIARHTFDRVSFDLMYGRQNQSVTSWETELTQALTLGLDHVSLYQLTIEPGTVFGDRYRVGKLGGLPDDDLSADMYALTQDICAGFDMPRYEVSNHAKDGSESRHNLIYWRYGDYVGIGPGAHGRVTQDGIRVATEQARIPVRARSSS